MTNTTQTKETGRESASLDRYWNSGYEWDTYFAEHVREHRDLWEGVYRKSRIPAWALEELAKMGRRWRLLVLAEDWCGDASNLVPIFARLAESSPHVDLRIVKRDENPELMEMYLTDGSRSIPIAVLLDEGGRPLGHWGPRPKELQTFVLREKRAGERQVEEIYKDVRRWYAKDRGETTLRELLDVMKDAA